MSKYIVVNRNNTPIFELITSSISGGLSVKRMVDNGFKAKLRQEFLIMGYFLAIDPLDNRDIYINPNYCDVTEIPDGDLSDDIDARQAFVNTVKSRVGSPYVYGMKGDILTAKKLETLRVTYPSMYTDVYYQKAQKSIGRQCFDCSGLVTWALNQIGIDFPIVNSHSLYYSHCYDIDRSELIPGDLLFREGNTRITHVAVYIGNNEIVEARGIDYGVIRREVPNTFNKFGRLHVLVDTTTYSISSTEISLSEFDLVPSSYEIISSFDANSAPQEVKSKVEELSGNLLLYYKNCILYNVKVISGEKKNNQLLLEWINLSNDAKNLELNYEIEVY